MKGLKASPIAASTGSRLVTSKTLEVEEFGPKHLLGYELKADARA